MKPSNGDTWFSTIDVSFMPHHLEELFKVPRKLKIDDKEFLLALFIVHSEEGGNFE